MSNKKEKRQIDREERRKVRKRNQEERTKEDIRRKGKTHHKKGVKIKKGK